MLEKKEVEAEAQEKRWQKILIEDKSLVLVSQILKFCYFFLDYHINTNVNGIVYSYGANNVYGVMSMELFLWSRMNRKINF